MPVDPKILNQALGRAAALCRDDSLVEAKVKSNRGKIQESLADGADFEMTSDPGYSMGSASSISNAKQMKGDPLALSSNMIEESALPPAIKNILHKSPEINVPTGLAGEMGQSVLAGMNIPQVKPQPVNETIIPRSTASSSIDYSLIKTIVEECIDRKLNTLNESNLKTIALKGGKIRLVDNAGNIYSAQLTKTGNINDKKK